MIGPDARPDAVIGGSPSKAVLPDLHRSRGTDEEGRIDQAYRTISTGQLHTLPHFNLQPINVVVYHGSQRDLVSRGASRLDAFSGYPVRT